jgi:hypothetical protein
MDMSVGVALRLFFPYPALQSPKQSSQSFAWWPCRWLNVQFVATGLCTPFRRGVVAPIRCWRHRIFVTAILACFFYNQTSLRSGLWPNNTLTTGCVSFFASDFYNYTRNSGVVFIQLRCWKYFKLPSQYICLLVFQRHNAAFLSPWIAKHCHLFVLGWAPPCGIYRKDPQVRLKRSQNSPTLHPSCREVWRIWERKTNFS